MCRRDQQYVLQQTEPWKQQYRIRSGIEGTTSEAKRSHGLGRLRVRRRSQVTLAVACTLTARNIKRWLSAVLAVPGHLLAAIRFLLGLFVSFLSFKVGGLTILSKTMTRDLDAA
ncbi:MAG: transposase [Deltaproteobacteria bacterium]|nr:transposase [Deltaproteobacteria bacterium]